ncbi:MAG: hypothetical protein PVF58_05200 [Candidatus Methanofastidiosia archaeon]|jgi:hypothetical protein
MGLFDVGKGRIILTLYDMVTGGIIREPIQVEIQREFNLIGTKVIKDGKLTIENRVRIEDRLLDIYYTCTLKITSNKYTMEEIICNFDRHTKKIELDIVLKPKKMDDGTKIY